MCVCPQLVSVIQKEPFQEFVTGRQECVCAARVSLGLAVTPAVEDTVILSLPVNFVQTASSLWTSNRGTSALLWRNFPLDFPLFLEVLMILETLGHAFGLLRAA